MKIVHNEVCALSRVTDMLVDVFKIDIFTMFECLPTMHVNVPETNLKYNFFTSPNTFLQEVFLVICVRGPFNVTEEKCSQKLKPINRPAS